jgi:hypothetical protein
MTNASQVRIAMFESLLGVLLITLILLALSALAARIIFGD